jgi:ubiquinone/menaquinone biosynthesis C-methylase UbiE
MQQEHKNKAEVEEYIHVCGEYTGTYEREKIAKDWAKKQESAAGVVQDFKKRVGNPEGKLVLDVGFGNGMYVAAFVKAGAVVSGVEVNSALLDIAQSLLEQEGEKATLVVYDGGTLPFAEKSFDYVYSVSVLEHVTNPAALLKEVERILKPGGKFYLAFPNRFNPKETHTGIYFLSYVSRDIARRWLGLLNRNTIDELNLHFISFFSLRRMMRGTAFTIVPETGSQNVLFAYIKKCMSFMGLHFSILRPHIMVILEKRM